MNDKQRALVHNLKVIEKDTKVFDECIGVSDDGWIWYLNFSLKTYLELQGKE